MENEDVILNQMEDTRTSLSEKLGSLEQQVASTVQGATTNVADTVEAVKESVEAVKDTVEAVKDTVTETVNSVKESVEQTISSVKDSVHEGFTAVKGAFDIPRHVRSHPWIMFAGSVAVGYFAESLLYAWTPRRSKTSAQPSRFMGETVREPAYEAPRPSASPQAGSSAVPSWLRSFEPELSKLKALAITTLVNSVRDKIVKVVPQQMASSVNEIIDSAVQKITDGLQVDEAGHGTRDGDHAHRGNGRTRESSMSES